LGATIGHVILAVSDFGRSAAFYDPMMLAMGFRMGMDEADECGSTRSYHSGSHALFLKWIKGREHVPFSRDVGLDHLAFKVRGKAAVDRLFAMVSRAGTKITFPPKAYPEYSGKYYAFYFRDPDGIPLEIASY
jgi:catechol 2,3-dioxygenase-like lactoylglutathione lyase family enzyme